MHPAFFLAKPSFSRGKLCQNSHFVGGFVAFPPGNLRLEVLDLLLGRKKTMQAGMVQCDQTLLDSMDSIWNHHEITKFFLGKMMMWFLETQFMTFKTWHSHCKPYKSLKCPSFLWVESISSRVSRYPHLFTSFQLGEASQIIPVCSSC